jgi:hypothetical protein
VTATQDLLVGIMAGAVGSLLLIGALANSPHLMQLAKARLLTDAVGARAARAIIAAIGALTIALGVLIAIGWRIKW